MWLCWKTCSGLTEKAIFKVRFLLHQHPIWIASTTPKYNAIRVPLWWSHVWRPRKLENFITLEPQTSCNYGITVAYGCLDNGNWITSRNSSGSWLSKQFDWPHPPHQADHLTSTTHTHQCQTPTQLPWSLLLCFSCKAGGCMEYGLQWLGGVRGTYWGWPHLTNAFSHTPYSLLLVMLLCG